MKSKNIVFSVFIVVVLIIIVSYKYWETPIDMNYEGVYLTYEGTSSVAQVRLEGTVYKSFLREDRMRYKLWIDDLELPLLEHRGKAMDNAQFTKSISLEAIRANLLPKMNEEIAEVNHQGFDYSSCDVGYSYIEDSGGSPRDFLMGKLVFNRDFSHLVIMINEYEGFKAGYIINENDKTSAIEMVKDTFGFDIGMD